MPPSLRSSLENIGSIQSHFLGYIIIINLYRFQVYLFLSKNIFAFSSNFPKILTDLKVCDIVILIKLKRQQKKMEEFNTFYIRTNAQIFRKPNQNIAFYIGKTKSNSRPHQHEFFELFLATK